jgi:hypothetical protein
MKKLIIILLIAIVLIPHTAMATRMWYDTDERDRINQQFSQMQAEIDALKKTVVTIGPASAIFTTDDVRITTLEKRVTTLEGVVNFIVDQVTKTMNTIIGLLTKLLAR